MISALVKERSEKPIKLIIVSQLSYKKWLSKQDKKILQFMKRVGYSNVNCFQNSIQEIVDGPWFELLKNSWTNNNRLERCAMMCGDSIYTIGEQNVNVSYKD